MNAWVLVLMLGASTSALGQGIHRCETNGRVTYQDGPCKGVTPDPRPNAPQSAARTDRSWTRLYFPGGATFELPREWTVLNGSQRITLDAFAKSASLDKSSALEFAANLYDIDGNTVAIVNLRRYPDGELTQIDVSAMTAEDLQLYNEATRQGVLSSLDKAGQRVVHWLGTRIASLAGKRALVVEYARRAKDSPKTFMIRLIRMHDAERTFTLTLSYQETADSRYAALIDRISESLRAK